MAKTIDLCTPCAAVIGEGYTLKVIRRGVNNKITCGHCNRRRFGATYEIEPKRKKKSEEQK